MAAKTRADIEDIIKRRFRGSAGDATIRNAINEAIRSAEHWLVPTTDSSTVTIADEDYDYSLPTDLVQLLQVWTRGDTDERWVEVPALQWDVYGTPGAQVLYLDSLGGLDSGDTIRLEYLARMSEMTASDSTLGIGEPMEPQAVNYIIEYVLHILHERESAKGESEAAQAAHARTAQSHYQKAQNILRRAFRGRPAGRMRPGYPNRSLG